MFDAPQLQEYKSKLHLYHNCSYSSIWYPEEARLSPGTNRVHVQRSQLVRHSFFFCMHGTYKHRINCSLHPHQYHPLVQAAKRANMPTTVFVRDAALAYIQKKTVLPHGIAEKAKKLEHENEILEQYLRQIVEKAEVLGRVTPREMRRLSKIALRLGTQVKVFSELLSLIPHDH